ncbi:hypothetical protein PILCRDRAFT_692147 [Piloderma croceum F 1598]|uniref:Uncharacterized protein n=1 Tax=Piloderma croceum (strain F 1598) TaxID=765440 RepID=A0A0C3F4Q3_PILCF|nr:hypothetical protein PILCRDRAFT_692147 [Piloderma croceum F 1598]
MWTEYMDLECSDHKTASCACTPELYIVSNADRASSLPVVIPYDSHNAQAGTLMRWGPIEDFKSLLGGSLQVLCHKDDRLSSFY